MNRDVIARNLTMYRKVALNLTQEELAEKLGYSQQTVSRAENGKTDATAEYLMAFARLANVSLDTLCGMRRDTIVVDGLTEMQRMLLEREAQEMREKQK